MLIVSHMYRRCDDFKGDMMGYDLIGAFELFLQDG